MPRMMNALLAATLTVSAAGCSTETEKSEPRQSPSVARTFRPAVPIPGIVRYDANAAGQRIGVLTYATPWSEKSNGAFNSGELKWFVCEQEGKRVIDKNVPNGAPIVDTNDWLRAKDGEWTPKPYYDLGRAVLPECAELNLAVPSPAS